MKKKYITPLAACLPLQTDKPYLIITSPGSVIEEVEEDEWTY